MLALLFGSLLIGCGPTSHEVGSAPLLASARSQPPSADAPASEAPRASAEQLLATVEQTYANLRSLEVSGTVRSDRDPLAHRHVAFRMSFTRPNRLTIRAEALQDERTVHLTQVNWNGQTVEWRDQKAGITNRLPLDNVVGMVSVGFGDQIELLTSLVLGRREPLRSRAIDPVRMPDETLAGRDCAVVEWRTPGSQPSRLWIDLKTNRIVRFQEGIRGILADFR